jgi:prepilin-type N-terminal cleavage/methylation domain-containing protein
MIHTPLKQAFSLVELSIVLVILGLLVGGVLSGQSLIRAAELRAVSSEYSRYVSATQTFRDKYFALPGDMPNAETFWGLQNASDCANKDSTTIATCNGDGNGTIDDCSGLACMRSFEPFRFWQHLANASLIEGRYTGAGNAASQYGTILGQNAPRSKLTNAGWIPFPVAKIPSGGSFYTSPFPVTSQNALQLGGVYDANSYLSNGVIRPEEAWNIDTKMDDGLPGLGKVTTALNTAIPQTNCASTNVTTTAVYSLNNRAIVCGLIMGF